MLELANWVESFRSAGRALTEADLAPPGQGALSVWTPEALLITREGALLGSLTDADLTEIPRTTAPPAATPALDTPIHRAVYVATGAKAILHAHPPHAVALSFEGQSFVPEDHEGRHELGTVPIVSARRNIVDAVAAALERSSIVLVAGHGSYARGADFAECLRWTGILEASARLIWLRAAMGRASGPGRNGAGAAPGGDG